MWRNWRSSLLLLVLLMVATGCQLTQAAFTRTAANAGSGFAAAAITLSYTHEGKITYAYASSSFVNYQSELDGLDQALPGMQGAPDKHTIQHLLDLYKPAIQAVDAPCLHESCDWRAQVAALNHASQAFLEVGGQ